MLWLLDPDCLFASRRRPHIRDLTLDFQFLENGVDLATDFFDLILFFRDFDLR